MGWGVGFGGRGTGRGRSHRGGRNSLGTRFEGRQLSDCHLPDRHTVPTLAMGGTAALASHAAAGAEGTGATGRERAALCVHGDVEALLGTYPGASPAGT